MRVFRIETEEGKGIYAAGFGHRFTRASLDLANRNGDGDARSFDLIAHPSPEEEPELRDFWLGNKLSKKAKRLWPSHGQREFFCGFDSMERLLEWWPPEGLRQMWTAMMPHNQTPLLVEYEIHGNQVKRGGKQCVFKKANATLISRKALYRLYPN